MVCSSTPWMLKVLLMELQGKGREAGHTLIGRLVMDVAGTVHGAACGGVQQAGSTPGGGASQHSNAIRACISRDLLVSICWSAATGLQLLVCSSPHAQHEVVVGDLEAGLGEARVLCSSQVQATKPDTRANGELVFWPPKLQAHWDIGRAAPRVMHDAGHPRWLEAGTACE